MRADLWIAAVVLTAVPVAAQRGVVNRVVVSSSTIRAGDTVKITASGTNPCGAVRIDYGDGTEAITHPITEIPATIEYIYTRPGEYRIRAEGMGNCDGNVTTNLRVLPRPDAPRADERLRADERVRAMDENGDGVVTRSEWRATLAEFRQRDTNRDGLLSGTELRAEATATEERDPALRFQELDANRNGVITRNEWPRSDSAFRGMDRDGDGVITRAEFADRGEPGVNGVVVDARQRWTETGIFLRRGDTVRIQADGVVRLSGSESDEAVPSGARSGRRAPSAPLPTRVAGALIARVGNSAAIFVGANATFRAPADGQLLLGVNDDYLDDNSGEFRVRIEESGNR
jgi:hypothetical protein